VSYKPAVCEGVFLRTGGVEVSSTHIWFLHGFGESSFSFMEAFESDLAEEFALLAPDLPGFGVTPPYRDQITPEGAAKVTASLIRQISEGKRIVLVGHSLGSVVATHLAQILGARVAGLFSVEGNLTPADGFFSAKAGEFEDAEAFYRYFFPIVYEQTVGSDEYQRYMASVRVASPEALLAWGKASARFGNRGVFGADFAALECPKLYYWGEQSTTEETQRLLAQKKIPHRSYRGAGHWPMVTTPQSFYSAVRRFIDELP